MFEPFDSKDEILEFSPESGYYERTESGARHQSG